MKMPSWKAWLMRPYGLIKRRGSPSDFLSENLDQGRECFEGSNTLN